MQIIVPMPWVSNHVIMQDEISEYPTVPITNETADYEEVIISQIELNLAIRHQTLVQRFLHILKFDFAGGDIEPFNIIFGKEYILLITY